MLLVLVLVDASDEEDVDEAGEICVGGYEEANPSPNPNPQPRYPAVEAIARGYLSKGIDKGEELRRCMAACDGLYGEQGMDRVYGDTDIIYTRDRWCDGRKGKERERRDASPEALWAEEARSAIAAAGN